MQRYKILHRTYYHFSAAVRLEPHALRLRPREGHELHIESSALEITPPASLRWHRDVEDNVVAIATFDSPASQLLIESEVIIQQYNQAPSIFWWSITRRTTRLSTPPRTGLSCRPI